MYPMTLLEWWHDGRWCEIGWRASTPESTRDLREHGRKLAETGGHYRLVHPSIYAGDHPPTVVHVYAEATHDSAPR